MRNNKYKSLALGPIMFINMALVSNAIASPSLSASDGVITDSARSLQWQDDYQNNDGEVKSGSYIEAKEYCSELTLSDKLDWRIPTQDELLSIVDKNREDDNQPSIHKIFQNVLVEEGYLSSTHYEDDDEIVWLVDYTSGESLDVALVDTDGYHIRCVRSNK